MASNIRHIMSASDRTKCQEVIIATYGSVFNTEGYDSQWTEILVNDVNNRRKPVEKEEPTWNFTWNFTWKDFWNIIWLLSSVTATAAMFYVSAEWFLEGLDLIDKGKYGWCVLIIPMITLVITYYLGKLTVYIFKNCV